MTAGSVAAVLLGACISSSNSPPSSTENDGGGADASADSGGGPGPLEDAGTTHDASPGSPEASSSQDSGTPAVIATLAAGAIAQPQHIAVSPTTGNLYVASFTGSYAVVTPAGTVTGTFGDAAASTHLVHAVGIALDAQGDVYVGDYGANAVLKFDPTGNYVATFDGSGSGVTFGRIAGVAVDANGTVYAADDDNGRIVLMNAQGTVTGQLATVPDGGSAQGTTGIAVSGANVWAAEYYDHDVEEIGTGAIVARFGTSGTSAALGTFSQPYALALAGTTLYVADNGANAVQALSTSGAFAWIVSGAVVDGGLVNPTGVAVSSDGQKLYVSDGAGARIVVYAL